MRDDNRQQENDLCLDLVRGESHFNFIKMHLLSHLCDNLRQFGNIPMYSTEIEELAHKTQIKHGWRQSNKNDAARQIVHSYGRQRAIRMRLLNLESLKCRDADLSGDVLHHLDRTASTVTAAGPVVGRRVLNRRREDVSNIVDFRRISGVSREIIYRELIQYSRHNLPAAPVFPRTMRCFDHSRSSYSHNLKSRFLLSKKPIFTRSPLSSRGPCDASITHGRATHTT